MWIASVMMITLQLFEFTINEVKGGILSNIVVKVLLYSFVNQRLIYQISNPFSANVNNSDMISNSHLTTWKFVFRKCEILMAHWRDGWNQGKKRTHTYTKKKEHWKETLKKESKNKIKSNCNLLDADGDVPSGASRAAGPL